MEENFSKPKEWANDGIEELSIPPEYLEDLKLQIVVLHPKKDFAFQCQYLKKLDDGAWSFDHVVIDTSEKEGGVVLKARVTYHPEIKLVNVPFMVIPLPEKEDNSDYLQNTDKNR